MDDLKLDYLERIKTLLEKDDVSNLTKYIARIKKSVENDPNFEEIIAEIDNKNYDLALNITEEVLYENSDNEFNEVYAKDSSDDMNDDEMIIGYEGESFNETDDLDQNY